MFGWLWGSSKPEKNGKPEDGNGQKKKRNNLTTSSEVSKSTHAIVPSVLNEFKQVNLPEFDCTLHYRFYGSLGMCMCLDGEITHHHQSASESELQDALQVSFEGIMRLKPSSGVKQNNTTKNASSSSTTTQIAAWNLCSTTTLVQSSSPSSSSLSYCFKLKLPSTLPPTFLSSNALLRTSYALTITNTAKPESRGYVRITVPVIVPVSPLYSPSRPSSAFDLHALPVDVTIVAMHERKTKSKDSKMTSQQRTPREQPQENLYCDLHPPIETIPPAASVSYNFVKSLQFDGLQDARICVVSLSQTSYFPGEIIHGLVEFPFQPADGKWAQASSLTRIDPDAPREQVGGNLNPCVLYCETMEVKLEAVETWSLLPLAETKNAMSDPHKNKQQQQPPPTEVIKAFDSIIKRCRLAVNSGFEFRLPAESRYDGASGFDMGVIQRQYRVSFSFTLAVLTRAGKVQSHVTGVKLPLRVKGHGDSFN